jgi:hypothetical protein
MKILLASLYRDILVYYLTIQMFSDVTVLKCPKLS